LCEIGQDHTGKVNLADYAALMSQWLISGKCPESDLNNDCWIDSSDFAIASDNWQYSDCTKPDFCNLADLNFDGSVDLEDLSMLLELWLTCGDDTGKNCTPDKIIQ